MRVELNLASRPFGRARLFWTASAAIGLLLLGLTGWQAWSYVDKSELPPALVERETELQAELVQLSREEAELRAGLGLPETIDIYDRSFFLNQLLTRKGISWTRTFADLEQVLPPRVLMMQLRPEVTIENNVRLEMQVGAETPRDFIEFLQALEGSDIFGAPDVRGYSPPNDNEPYFRYELMVSYEQQL